jgi:hypothetical protein
VVWLLIWTQDRQTPATFEDAMSAMQRPLAGALAGIAFLAVAHSAQPDPHESQAEAGRLMAEGKVLEQEGKLSEARDKYVDATGLVPSSEARSAIARIDERQSRQVRLAGKILFCLREVYCVEELGRFVIRRGKGYSLLTGYAAGNFGRLRGRKLLFLMQIDDSQIAHFDSPAERSSPLDGRRNRGI